MATKESDTFQYLARDSAHPKSVFGGLIKGETLRYARNCSHRSDFEERVNLYKEHLTKRGYAQSEPDHFTQMTERKNSNMETGKSVSKGNNIPLVLVLPYFPQISHNAVKRALVKHWGLIEGNEFLKTLVRAPPMVAYTRQKTLKDQLIRSKLKVSPCETQENSLNRENLRVLLELLREQV